MSGVVIGTLGFAGAYKSATKAAFAFELYFKVYQKGITSLTRSALFNTAGSDVLIDQYGIQPVKILRGWFALLAGLEVKRVNKMASNAKKVVSAVLFFRRFTFESVIDFFTHWADWIFFRIARWDPLLATKSSY